jgi:hypothetical protein
MAANGKIGWYTGMSRSDSAIYKDSDKDPSGNIMLNLTKPRADACAGSKVNAKLWAIIRLVHEGSHILDEENEYPTGAGSSVEEEFNANVTELAVYRAFQRVYKYCDKDSEKREKLYERTSRTGKTALWDALKATYPYPTARTNYGQFRNRGFHAFSKESLLPP